MNTNGERVKITRFHEWVVSEAGGDCGSKIVRSGALFRTLSPLVSQDELGVGGRRGACREPDGRDHQHGEQPSACATPGAPANALAPRRFRWVP